ncbi:2-polyprenyl-6-methoxyphenol hydroxylase [Dyadobacter soli]|uniref:Flavin-dependent monooxygenase n=1 Tax=Dyadobacter soli TaxID=659014 RepID=A0A1G7SAJ6_9BACT|nr:NAD(P)/FAD-dependent oxidoreductase [Dyadobacter soli]SDG20066.1 2-polyprenyl-6-methoxyphenol hydroxylase [Dyadobacter soli]
MLLTNKQVAIIGGGPGGLTLARLLQIQGVSVKVYERDYSEHARVQGATLDLHYESGLKVMEAAGLMDAFRAAYRPGAEKGRVVDEYGNILFEDGREEAALGFGDEAFRPEIDRGPLRNMLLASLLPGTVIWNSHFKNMSRTDGAWLLEFHNGTTATADIVVGADGANSKIRPFITPERPFYSGITILQGNVPDSAMAVPDIHKLLNGGKLYIHAGGKFLHLSSKGDGSLDFYITFKKDEHWVANGGIDFSDKSHLHTWAAQEFAGWSPLWLDLFEHAEIPLLERPQYCMPLDQQWESLPDLTMLGDAAHPMPPSGEGVNLAMLDALDLSECLTSAEFPDIRAAINAYESRMQERAAKEARESLEMSDWMLSEGAATRMVEILSQ